MYWVDQVTFFLLGLVTLAFLGLIATTVWWLASAMISAGVMIFLIVPICAFAGIMMVIAFVWLTVMILG